MRPPYCLFVRVVVAAAIVRNGLVLAARRSAPAELAGRWEFPGGKIELDETPQAALVRECREELGVDLVVGSRIGHANGHVELHLYAASLVGGEPTPLQDHDELRWLGPGELDAVDWLPIDLALLDSVRPLLRQR